MGQNTPRTQGCYFSKSSRFDHWKIQNTVFGCNYGGAGIKNAVKLCAVIVVFIFTYTLRQGTSLSP